MSPCCKLTQKSGFAKKWAEKSGKWGRNQSAKISDRFTKAAGKAADLFLVNFLLYNYTFSCRLFSQVAIRTPTNLVLAGVSHALIESALESTDPGTANGGANFEIRLLGAELTSFEVAKLPQKWKLIDKDLSGNF